MTKFKLKLELPGLPKTTNSNLRKHWASQYAEANKWKKSVALMCSPFKPKKPLESATITLIRHSGKAPDYDGLVSSFKHILDGLVVAGIIANDTMACVGKPNYDWQKAPNKQGKIVIIVDEN